jgi:hypothetical protein
MNKICIKCNVEYDISFYETGRNTCKSCRNLQTKKRREENIKLINYNDLTTTKKCCHCNLELNITSFNVCKTSKSGYSSKCKECYSKTRCKTKKNIIPDSNIKFKICIRCKTNKEISNFETTSKTNDNYFSYCKECTPEKTWTKEKQRISEKKYVTKNIDKIREKWKRQGKKINRRVRDSLNHRISEALLTQNLTKRNTTFNYVGCSRDELKKWFEHIFEEGMSWDNYGEWHIDHVIPCSSFDLSKEDDIIKCFSWKNLRPCWSKDNIMKGNKIINNIISEHYDIVNKYINSTTKL